MDGVLKKSLNNLKYVFSAQLLVLIINFLRAIIVPIVLTVEGFGYWQIYLFYASYVGMFALGYNDGIYLRYGEFQYKDLPHKKLRDSLLIHCIIIMFFFILGLVFSSFIDDSDKQFSLRFVCFNIFIMGLNGVFIYIFQITNQMKKYSFFSIFPQVIFIVGLLVTLLLNSNQFKLLVIIDSISKTIAVFGMMLYCKELWIGKFFNLKDGIKEYFTNVSIGIQLMLAQLMGMFVTGIGRIIVEYFGDISEYSYYSLGITVTSLVLVLISSVSMLAYPTLKRLNDEDYHIYYNKINDFLQKFNLITPSLFFMASLFISLFLPKYIPVLSYLNVLFGVIMMQAKMQLLNNTFYKVLRKETEMMKANISSVIIFTILSVVIFPLTNTIISIAFCTLAVMAYRCYSSEIYLRKVLKIKNYKGIFYESLYIVLFCILTTVLELKQSFILYFCFLVLMCYKYRFLFRKIKKHS